jgi:prepilin-type N-terminal cleavage/methylation domain-containing protein
MEREPMKVRRPSRKSNRQPRSEQGFTLVEMIVTVVLLAMITGALSAAFVTGLRASSSSNAHVKQTNDAQIIAGFLTRDAQAAGGTDPATGVADPLLGVSTDRALANGCDIPGIRTPTPATGVVGFKWIDRSSKANTTHVANYSYVPANIPATPFKAHQLVRTVCSGLLGSALGSPSSLVLANQVVGPPSMTCNVNQACVPFPKTVTMQVTETNTPPASGSYSFTLTASLRPQNGTQAVPTIAAPLIILGRPGCGGSATPPDNTTGLSVQASIGSTVNVRGNTYINAVDNGCHAMNLSGGFLNTFNTTQASILNGGTCIGACPPITSYSPAFTDPYAGLAPPSTAGLPVFNTSTCSGTMSPGVYTNTLTDGNLFGSCVLNNGVYILKGGIAITNGASLSSNGGVLLYIPPTSAGGSPTATFNGTATGGINLTGISRNDPLWGQYAGLAVWQAGTTTVQFGATFLGFNNISINGTVYAPVAQVKNTFSILGGVVSVSGIVAQTLVESFSFGATMNIGIPLTITTASLPQWTVNQPNYSATLAAVGGTLPYTWSATGLPAGLSMSSGGVISGKPNGVPGPANVSVSVTDPAGDSASALLSLVINPQPSIATALATGWTQTFDFHNVQLSTNGTGTAGYTWSVTAGNLPSGLSMSSGGLITGSPTTLGSSTFTITVVDAAGATATRTYTIQINPVPTISGPATLPSPWNANNPYPAGNTGTVTNGTGTAPFTWNASLPTGLMIDANTGAITGTPTVVGPFPNSSITVKDAAGAAATRTYSITINPQLGFQAGTPTTGEQGIPYSYTVVASGGSPPYTITATGLPAPLMMSTAGVISGTPAASGSFPITATVKDSTNATTTNSYTLTIAAPVSFTGSLHDWTVGRDYTAATMTPAGGVGTRTFTATGLPTGLLMSSAGSVTGTPTGATGLYNVSVKVQDSLGGTQTQILPLTLNPAPIIATTSLPAGERTVNYGSVALALQAGTGTAPITWQVSGLAASGLNFSGNTISGTPTAGGSFNVTITALDAAGVSTQQIITLVIAQTPQGSPQTLPQWTINHPGYSAQINPATLGSGSYTYAVTAGALPAGLAMSNTGQISSTPTASGTANFTVTITDSLGGTGTQAEQIVINGVPTITSTSLPGGVLNTAYNAPIASTGGTPSLTWAVTVGTLPAGLTLNASTGAITGAPTTAGTSNFTVTLTDALGVVSAPKALSITVTTTPPATVTSVSPTSRGQGAPNQSIVINGTGFVAGAPLAAVFSNPGITVVSTTWNTAIKLTAVISVSGSATPGAGTVSVINGNGVPATGSPTFTVNAGPTITSISPSSHSSFVFSGVVVTINGAGFVSGATVALNATVGTAPTITNTTWVNSAKMTITINIPFLVTSTNNVVVTNPDGGTVTVVGGFKAT